MKNEITITSKEFYAPIKDAWISQSSLNKELFDMEVSFCLQHFNANPYLMDCSKDSVLKAVLNIAQTGLTLNPVMKYAYLVPRYNSKKNIKECVLEPSYTGLVKLLTDTGNVISIDAQIIWEGDNIEIDMASNNKIIRHIPYILTSKPKGNILGVYSKAVLNDGSIHCEIMSNEDIEDIRERSESYKAFKSNKVKSCIWESDKGEMYRKTVIKRHFKYLPKSEKLQTAIELDNQLNGYEERIGYEFIGYLETKIINSLLPDTEKTKLLKELETIEYKYQGNDMMNYLRKHQPVIGLESFPTTQNEIVESVINAEYRDNK